MNSSEILNTRGAVVLLTVLVISLMTAGCLGNGGSGPKTSMGPPDTGAPPDTGGPSDLGEWAVVREGGVAVGYEHTGHDLMAKFDASGENPRITASSPMLQPTVAGTWSGRWSARYTALTSDYGELDETDAGTARIDVTIAGSTVDAMLTYSGIDIPGIPSSVSSARASVTDGRFAPSITVSIPTESGGRVSRTYRGLGQFGGTQQQGVAGYVSGQDFLSVFYGDRQ